MSHRVDWWWLRTAVFLAGEKKNVTPDIEILFRTDQSVSASINFDLWTAFEQYSAYPLLY